VVIYVVSFDFCSSAGHFENPMKSGSIISPNGTSIRSPSGPAYPTLEQIFQKAITLRLTHNKTKGMTIKRMISSGANSGFFTMEMSSC
jgi:hypothetical protein